MSALQFKILDGSSLDKADFKRQTSKILITRELADKQFPEVNPIGKNVEDPISKMNYTVIGVIKIDKNDGYFGSSGVEAIVPLNANDPVYGVKIYPRTGAENEVRVEVSKYIRKTYGDTFIISSNAERLQRFILRERAIFTLLAVFTFVIFFTIFLNTYSYNIIFASRENHYVSIIRSLGASRLQVLLLCSQRGLLLAVIAVIVSIIPISLIAYLLSGVELYQTAFPVKLNYNIALMSSLFIVIASVVLSTLPVMVSIQKPPAVGIKGKE